jgi:integrase
VGLIMSRITNLKAKNIAPGDKPVADGTIRGLRLEPGSAKGQGKWILRFVSPVTGKRRDRGLGAYPEVGIADARVRGLAARQSIASGKDPIEEREADRAARAAIAGAMTFEQAARRVHEGLKPGWKNAKHMDQWINTLRDYAFPRIGKRKVKELSPADFAEVLRPIWLAKPETASRVKQRCHTVMKWCWAQEMVKGNPVDVVDHLLPQQPGKRERTQHQPSMPWRDIPAFVQGVLHAGASNVTRALLEFVILTAARSGEARAMTWAEVDLETRVWTVPANRMKAKVVHRVPLSRRAVEILEAQRALHPDADLVFPAPRGAVLSDMVLTGFLRNQIGRSSDKGRVATAHGFRSSFRDWASENGYARDLAERALAHTIANQAEAAYHRTDLLEQRRAMMEAWAKNVRGGEESTKVVPLRGRKK